jgi:hypothetical protein
MFCANLGLDRNVQPIGWRCYFPGLDSQDKNVLTIPGQEPYAWSLRFQKSSFSIYTSDTVTYNYSMWLMVCSIPDVTYYNSEDRICPES